MTLIVWLAIPLVPAWAKSVSAEIINVNYPQQIVFIDQGKDFVKVGDVFSVNAAGAKVFLEVIDTSDSVSALSPSDKPSFRNDLTRFENVSIGSKAERILEAGEAPPAVAAPQASEAPAGPSPQMSAAEEQLDIVAELKKQVSEANHQAAQAQTEREKYKKQNQELQAKIMVLKDRLDYLTQLVDDHLKL